MNSGKVSLENASAQWELYDDATGKLSKWMSDTDAGLKLEAALQNTLPEKRAQLDRIKVSLWGLMLFSEIIVWPI